ncbi:MAG: hypothetical protein ACI4ML_07195, partial [Aristaeellaceae bacterium]
GKGGLPAGREEEDRDHSHDHQDQRQQNPFDKLLVFQVPFTPSGCFAESVQQKYELFMNGKEKADDGKYSIVCQDYSAFHA